MKYYLYTFNDNWADEMDIEGFAVLSYPEKTIVEENIRRKFKSGGSICFGTNEDNNYDTLEEVLDCITFKEISQTHYDVIKKTIGQTFGQLGPIDSSEFCVLIDEEESEEDDSYEDEYDASAMYVYNSIKKEFGLLGTLGKDFYANFIWKPTPSSEINISILKYEDAEESIDEDIIVRLKYNGKERHIATLGMESVYCNFSLLEKQIKEFIEKAKSY